MAQSPESASDTIRESYTRGWDALGALIAQGKSFSGRERNCAFINTGVAAPSFACGSGALNLDQIDDSRAVIPVDWDGDGDLDLWYSNRTGPRLRFLRNDVAAGNHWLALKLEGRTGNRDAIGARAELTLVSAAGQRRTLWRRLYAGDSFLSQPPRTLHFGFRSDESIEKLVIRWPAPGMAEQQVSGISADQVWRITEGQPPVKVDSPRLTLPAGSAFVPPVENTIRAPLVNRLPLSAAVEYLDPQGRVQKLSGPQAKPTLILFWGSWCPVCRGEMQELTAKAASLGGLRILALAVDTAKAEPPKTAPDDVRRALEAIAWPFDSGFATRDTIRNLALLESQSLYPERALALPTSYLLGADGRLAVIYHGPAGAETLTKDAVFASTYPADPENAVFPFPGRSAKKLFPLSSTGIAQALREAGYLDESRASLEGVLSRLPAGDIAGRVALLRRLGDLEDEAGRFAEAATAWQRAVELTPDDPSLHLAHGASLWRGGKPGDAASAFTRSRTLTKDAAGWHTQMGRVWQALGEHANAAESFSAALAAVPDNRENQFNLAVARQFAGDTAQAIAGYESLLAVNPGLLEAASNLAWLRATARDAALRQPTKSLELAVRVNQATAGNSPAVLDNLAAAQAAAGRLPAAIETASHALKLARATGEDTLAADIRKHLESYQSGKPWIE